jgi:hypothetical protein
VTVFALDSNGYPNAISATTPYQGVSVVGARLVNINDPEPRRITHFGDDHILQLDVLPPQEAMTGELQTATVNDDLDALLANVNSFAVDTEIKGLLLNTEKKGSEPQVGVLGYRQSLDTNGNRVWRSIVFPKAVLVPRESNMDDNPEARSYPITPMIVTKHLWGTAFASGTEGATQAQAVRLVTAGKPKIIAWLGDGSTTTFTLPTAYPASSTSKMHVYDNGTLTPPTTTATTSLVYTTAPANGHNITLVYEHA